MYSLKQLKLLDEMITFQHTLPSCSPVFIVIFPFFFILLENIMHTMCTKISQHKLQLTCDPLSRTVALVVNWHSARSTSLKSESFSMAATKSKHRKFGIFGIINYISFHALHINILPEQTYFAAWSLAGYNLNARVMTSFGFII